jgi:hypothetical protein
VRISHLLSRSLLALSFLCAFAFINSTSAQTTNNAASAPVVQPTPTVIVLQPKGPASVAGQTDLYCAGFIQYVPAPLNPEIVGGEQEQEQHTYSQGNYVYLNAGSQQGIHVGQEFAIVRPRGQMTSKFTAKKGWLGVYMQEVGQLRVVNVKDQTSVAVITNSCDTILLGDLLRDVNNRVAPEQREETTLDRFADPTGKQKGRIVMARDGREMVTSRQIVYIDLGAEDNIKAGDYFTIYRPLGTGNITRVANEEIAISQSGGFESDSFHGGKFSIQSQRTKDYTNTPGLFFKNEPLTTYEIRRHRPSMPRKIVGELVILSVQTRTATAIITRVAQEIHTGDFVELQ